MAVRIETDASSDVARFLLAGTIDSDFNLAAELPELPPRAVLDLSRIERINSVGLLHWLRWIQGASAGKDIAVEGVSYSFVLQANNLVDLFGRAKVRSCLAPYFCGKCRAAREALVRAEEVGADLPVKHCESCGSQMEFDELDEYFAFLRRQR